MLQTKKPDPLNSHHEVRRWAATSGSLVCASVVPVHQPRPSYAASSTRHSHPGDQTSSAPLAALHQKRTFQPKNNEPNAQFSLRRTKQTQTILERFPTTSKVFSGAPNTQNNVLTHQEASPYQNAIYKKLTKSPINPFTCAIGSRISIIPLMAGSAMSSKSRRLHSRRKTRGGKSRGGGRRSARERERGGGVLEKGKQQGKPSKQGSKRKLTVTNDRATTYLTRENKHKKVHRTRYERRHANISDELPSRQSHNHTHAYDIHEQTNEQTNKRPKDKTRRLR